LVWADGAYAGAFARWLEAERGWRVEVPKHRGRHLRRHGLSGHCQLGDPWPERLGLARLAG
jgi:hypothetical protein